MSSETETVKTKSKRTLTPKLRFPEFLKEPGWDEVPLEQIAARVTTKNLDGSIARVLTNSAEHGIVDQRDYFDKDIANASNIDGYYIVDLGDYVYNPRVSTLAPVGPISRNNIGKGVMSPLYTVFRFAAENTDFYQHYFKTVSWHLYLRRVSSMGARHDRMSITTGDFMAMPVPTPPAREQEKIADCLGSLAELIAAEGRKLTALRDQKRGLMQQLFPQPGQTQPRLRFPEFLDKGGWESVKLSNVFEEFREKSTVQDQYEVLTSARSGLIRQKDYYGKGRITGRENIGFNIIPPNYLTYRSRSDDRRFYFNENDLGITGIISTYYPVFRVLDGSNKFFIELLAHHQASVGEYSVGTSQTVLSLPMLGRIKLPLPTPAEQHRIADCLSALDARITAQAEKVNTLKQHKRGLMQQLFPAPEEP